MKVVRGDITETKVDYIIQQCNCLTVRAHGLSETLEKKFPHADLYGRRRAVGGRNLAIPEDRSTPGTAVILQGSPNIVCVFGQWRPGKIGVPYFDSYPESVSPETSTQRLTWFTSGLDSFGNYLSLTSSERVTVGIPWKIGCGLAGGNWDDYLSVIETFNEKFSKVVDVTLFCL